MFAIRIGVVPQDDEDLMKVNELQQKFATTSLSRWGDPSKLGKVNVPRIAKRPNYSGDLQYFQAVADLLIENPPPKDQEAAVILLGRGGIEVGKPFDPSKLDEPARRGLARAEEMGPQIMRWKVKYRGTPYPTRWNNLRPGDYGFDYLDRAAGALEGLFVHDREEAEYFSTYESGDAQLLDGANNYLVHFDKDALPPTLDHGFWSFTMYGSDFQLVKNPINRFSIGDRTKGLAYNADGSLDLYIQHEAPAWTCTSNWLPSLPAACSASTIASTFRRRRLRTRRRSSNACPRSRRRLELSSGVHLPRASIGPRRAGHSSRLRRSADGRRGRVSEANSSMPSGRTIMFKTGLGVAAILLFSSVSEIKFD